MTLNRHYLILTAILFAATVAAAQKQINTISTSNSSAPPITYSNIKGAGMKTAYGILSSNWDSIASNYTVNFNASPNNITSITQFTVAGLPNTFISWPVNSFIKLRRNGNAYVNDARNHYNFWSAYSSAPIGGLLLGTFNLVAPEITSPENAFLSNNINSGYDNIFQNSINNLHAGNIERVDCILPVGLRPTVQSDVDNAGVVVFDRGTGDPFKVAAILSLDNNNNPLTYGPLVSITAAQFGPDLLPSNINYCIMVNDPLYGARSRPSTFANQNIRGVYMTLSDLGLAVNQAFYGYSVFGPDVATANPDWTTYPTNTNGNSMLDPVNVMTIFKDANSLLPIGLSFTLTKQNNKPLIKFPVYDIVNNQTVVIERSADGRNYAEVGGVAISQMGTYYFTDEKPLSGTSFYRLKLVEKTGGGDYSDVKTFRLNGESSLQVSPNPAKDLITISVPTSWQQKQITVALFDAAGALVQKKNFTTSTTELKFTLNKVNTGTYFLHIANLYNQESVVKQIIISK